VNAAGPFLQAVHSLVVNGEPPGPPSRLPITNELHGKVIFRDSKQAAPASSPMVICSDPTSLYFSPEDRAALLASDFPHRDQLLSELPSGLHFRHLGNNHLAILWEHVHAETPAGDPPDPQPEFNPLFPEIVTRGLASVIPRFHDYLLGTENLGAKMDGGYYTKTPSNLPLIDEYAAPRGAFICGALSGFGVMSACAAGELTALRISGKPLPAYANAFEIAAQADAERLGMEPSTPGSRPRDVQL